MTPASSDPVPRGPATAWRVTEAGEATAELRLAEAARDPRAYAARALLALQAARRKDREACDAWLADPDPTGDADGPPSHPTLRAAREVADAAWGAYRLEREPEAERVAGSARAVAQAAGAWALAPALAHRAADDPHAAQAIASGLIEAGRCEDLLRLDAALDHALPLVLGDRRRPLHQARVEVAEALGWRDTAHERASQGLGEFPRDERLALALHRIAGDEACLDALDALERVHREHPGWPDIAAALEARRAIEQTGSRGDTA
ncbi:MAG: hypothetical protein AAGA57_02135 [Planctomycetota bacterium]